MAGEEAFSFGEHNEIIHENETCFQTITILSLLVLFHVIGTILWLPTHHSTKYSEKPSALPRRRTLHNCWMHLVFKFLFKKWKLHFTKVWYSCFLVFIYDVNHFIVKFTLKNLKKVLWVYLNEMKVLQTHWKITKTDDQWLIKRKRWYHFFLELFLDFVFHPIWMFSNPLFECFNGRFKSWALLQND